VISTELKINDVLEWVLDRQYTFIEKILFMAEFWKIKKIYSSNNLVAHIINDFQEMNSDHMSTKKKEGLSFTSIGKKKYLKV
jgi:hypothetical protein